MRTLIDDARAAAEEHRTAVLAGVEPDDCCELLTELANQLEKTMQKDIKPMAEQETPAVELAFTELAAVIREKDELGFTFDEYLKELAFNASAANRKLEVARAVADMCEATKTRKPRKDRGVPRKKNGEAVVPADENCSALQ